MFSLRFICSKLLVSVHDHLLIHCCCHTGQSMAGMTAVRNDRVEMLLILKITLLRK